MTVHASQQKWLDGVGSSVEAVVEFLILRPECQRKTAYLQYVAAHTASACLCLGDGLGQLVDRADVFADVCRNQRQASIDSVAVTVDQSRCEEVPLEIDRFGTARNGFGDFRAIAHRNDLVATDSDRLSVGIIGFRGEDLSVVEHPLVGLRKREDRKEQ